MSINRKHQHVLLVDDDAALRFALRKALTRLQWNVSTAANGHEALSYLQAGHILETAIDIAVLDLRMPNFSGLDVIMNLSKNQIPIIMLTGHGSIDDAVKAMQYGACDFLQKPIDGDTLSTCLQKHIKNFNQGQQDKRFHVGESIPLDVLEKEHIRSLLQAHQNISEVARILQIDRRTLQRKLDAWGMRSSKI